MNIELTRLAERLGITHDNVPREELVKIVCAAAFLRIDSLAADNRKQRARVEEYRLDHAHLVSNGRNLLDEQLRVSERKGVITKDQIEAVLNAVYP